MSQRIHHFFRLYYGNLRSSRSSENTTTPPFKRGDFSGVEDDKLQCDGGSGGRDSILSDGLQMLLPEMQNERDATIEVGNTHGLIGSTSPAEFHHMIMSECDKDIGIMSSQK